MKCFLGQSGMRLHLVVLSSLALISPLCRLSADPISQINQLVVFGDSLSDDGNAYIASGGAFPGPNYAVGRYTDGPNTTPKTTGPFGLWEEQLAGDVGLADPQPFLAGGTTYAVASAETGSNGKFDVTDQLNYFKVAHPGGAPNGALYTIWAGANDIFDGKNPVTAADNLFANIQTLHSEGAKYFLWLNLPPLGDTPYGYSHGLVNGLNTLTTEFNNEWSVDLGKLQSSGIQVVGVNIGILFNQIAADPSVYGFTDIKDSARGLAGVNPNDYLFWDDVHPTTAADALVADLALHDFVATPEPATFGLIGLCGLLLAGFRMRRKNVSC
ncbi:MAG: SGNH/GDSL hydrolase family protein [Acidobacteriaceae bacterium]|nr:SGNH/GDSL hydrolase family protein [Acidobacteriaceae bacterium]